MDLSKPGQRRRAIEEYVKKYSPRGELTVQNLQKRFPRSTVYHVLKNSKNIEVRGRPLVHGKLHWVGEEMASPKELGFLLHKMKSSDQQISRIAAQDFLSLTKQKIVREPRTIDILVKLFLSSNGSRLSNELKWILLHVLFQIAAQAHKRNDEHTLLRLGEISSVVSEVARNTELPADMRDVALEFLSVTDSGSAFQAAIEILKKDGEENYAVLSSTVQLIVKGEAEKERLKVRATLYDIASKFKNEPRKRSLELLLLTRTCGL